MELETRADFNKDKERVNAWYRQELIDREPIRFRAHNSEYSIHPGIDCLAALRDPQQLCLDLLMKPDQAKKVLKLADDMIKKEKVWPET